MMRWVLFFGSTEGGDADVAGPMSATWYGSKYQFDIRFKMEKNQVQVEVSASEIKTMRANGGRSQAIPFNKFDARTVAAVIEKLAKDHK